MPRKIEIDGADPAAAVQKILDAAKRDGVELVLHHESGTLKLEHSSGAFSAVTVRNDGLGLWRALVTEFRRRSGMKAEPSGLATYQQGSIRNDSPKRGEIMGELLFRVKMNRLIKRELPSRVTMIPAQR